MEKTAASHSFPEKQVILSAPLIARHNLNGSREAQNCEKVSHALLSLTTVRLDRKNITVIGALEELKAIHSLYLQHNRIKKIKNLEGLTNLRFLTLAWNQISVVENLKTLYRLGFLDLSYNLIKHLNVGELPPNLVILNLTGNHCTQKDNYRQTMIEALPTLQELDGETIPDQKEPDREQEENELQEDSDYESEDEDDWLTEISSPLDVAKDLFINLHENMIGRSKQRQQDVMNNHKARLEEIAELKTQMIIRHNSNIKNEKDLGRSADIHEGPKPDLTNVGIQKPVRAKTNAPCTLPATKTSSLKKNSTRVALPSSNSKEQQPSRPGSLNVRITTEQGLKTPSQPATRRKNETDTCQALPARNSAVSKQADTGSASLKTEKQISQKGSPSKSFIQTQKAKNNSLLKSKSATGQRS
ncbi:leucine-rich repeat-containing protein 46 [Protopterus annectens]|uniref:leucine-rich repeat-containing protein 46 n=1 Tax=Protopterus annectens TaxID=7888 RepID=UPI001CFBFE59|nr:leucine-rich repeat-containing protein 46 [Protopterus annectens]